VDTTQQGCSDWTLLGLSILRIEKTFYLAAFPNSFICNSRNFKSRSMRLILSSVASESTQQDLDRTKLPVLDTFRTFLRSQSFDFRPHDRMKSEPDSRQDFRNGAAAIGKLLAGNVQRIQQR